VSSLLARPSGRLTGQMLVPGDKSMSHRALMLGGVAIGETHVAGLLEGEDVMATADAMRALGAEIERLTDGTWRVRGRGVGGLAEPAGILDLGNSGTGARLLIGLVAGHPITAFFTGDASLCRRPMSRVTTPLVGMGAQFITREGGRLPLAVRGAEDPMPIRYELPVASAQVKSAILLAGLNTPGETVVIEPHPTRDHTESMLRHFGAEVRMVELDGGACEITLVGQPELIARDIVVPADPSSAAFPAVAALITEGSEIELKGVGTNPLRFGLFETLAEMGADIEIHNRRVEAGEPVADLRVRSSTLTGIEVPAERAPSMIDEYPILAIAAARAKGTTVMRGVGELRVKESDRLGAVARGLTACGVRIEEGEDTLVVHGGNQIAGGAEIAADFDHRIAMAFLVLGLVAERPVSIDDGRTINTSFPGFVDKMTALGAEIVEGGSGS
jgi:3-phosphoshikimate 1-carboxyvinyltransferase